MMIKLSGFDFNHSSEFRLVLYSDKIFADGASILHV